MQQTPWIERRFNFDFPAGVFPCIVERVRGTPARLEEMIGQLPAGILTVRVEEKWSIQEIIGHLATLEELHNGRIDDFLARREVLRAADMTNRKTADANFNAQSVHALLRSFRELRTNFCRRLASLQDEVITRSALHPRLNVQMRLVDMVLFVAEHDDHELAKIARLGRSLHRDNAA